MKKTKVLLLFGGQSGEHEISCATAAGVMGALDRERFQVVAVGISPDGQWVRQSSLDSTYRLHEGHGSQVKAADSFAFLAPHAGVLGTLNGSGNFALGNNLDEIDVVFPLLHGPFGEDGTIQGLLEVAGFRYVGCGVAASAVCMDKHLTKTVLAAAGIEVGKWRLVSRSAWENQRDQELERLGEVGFPCFVKPCRAGSSLGISKVDDPHQLEAAIEEAHRFDPSVIVEGLQTGREIECGVLQFPDGTIKASLPGEIVVPEGQFYDYDTKYREDSPVQLRCPADLPDELVSKVRQVAVAAFEAVGAEGLARVDFFVDPSRDYVAINEINTMPGFTPFSMYPTMWQKTGIDYTQLLTTLIEQALARPLGMR